MCVCIYIHFDSFHPLPPFVVKVNMRIILFPLLSSIPSTAYSFSISPVSQSRSKMFDKTSVVVKKLRLEIT